MLRVEFGGNIFGDNDNLAMLYGGLAIAAKFAKVTAKREGLGLAP